MMPTKNLVENNIIQIINDSNNDYPTRATNGSLGYDLKSSEDTTVAGFSWEVINTKIKIKIMKKNYGLLILPRSGLALRYGLTVLNSPGLIDGDYHDYIKIILMNHNKFAYSVRAGDRIAQLILMNAKEINWVPVEKFNINSTKRKGGFGSTGK